MRMIESLQQFKKWKQRTIRVQFESQLGHLYYMEFLHPLDSTEFMDSLVILLKIKIKKKGKNNRKEFPQPDKEHLQKNYT